MASTVQELVDKALHLPTDQRISLAHKILASIEPPSASEIERAWEAEIQKRIARYDAGRTRTIPAAKVFAEAGRRLKR